MYKDSIAGFSICGFETVLTVTQTNEVFQTASIILTCISTLVVIAYTIWKWWKSATDENSKGGKKITKDEVDELFDDINRTIEIKEDQEDGDRDKR